MSTLICSFDGLHDNRVLRYCADFKSHSLHMDTQTEAGEKTQGEQLLGTEDQYVQGIPIVGKGSRDKAVVGGIVG